MRLLDILHIERLKREERLNRRRLTPAGSFTHISKRRVSVARLSLWRSIEKQRHRSCKRPDRRRSAVLHQAQVCAAVLFFFSFCVTMKMFPRQDERHRVIQLMLFIRTNTARRLSASLIVSLPLRFLRSGAENLRWSQTENNKGIPFFHSDEIARQRPTNKTVMRKNNPMCR